MGIFQYISFAACTNEGLVRGNNEDALLCMDEVGLFLISDGMGGASAGELASQMVKNAVQEALENSHEDSPGVRKFAVNKAISKANAKIRAYAKEHNFRQMGATLAMFLLNPWQPGQAMTCHAGDSRIYRFRDGKLCLLTSDHTVGNELRRQGYGEKALKDTHIDHVLTRAIGVSDEVTPEWNDVDIVENDLFMLCSDGITTMLSNEQLQKIFRKENDVQKLLNMVEEAVRNAGARDNYTMILCRVLGIPDGVEQHSSEEIEENDYLLGLNK